MKISASQAAFLYLLLFNIGEGGNESHQALEDEANQLLRINNYPDDTKVIFDNEGEPQIDWKSWDRDFNWDKWLYGETGGLDGSDEGPHLISINDAMDFTRPLEIILLNDFA